MPSAVRFTTSSMMSRASCEAVMSRKTSSSAPCASYAIAASTGSPASRRSTNRTPFTTRPSLTSRHGMMRLASMLGPARGGTHRVRQRDGAGVERAPDHDALDAGVGDGGEGSDIGHAADAAGGADRHPHRARQRRGLFDIGPALGPIARDIRIEESGGAGLKRAPTHLRDPD